MHKSDGLGIALPVATAVSVAVLTAGWWWVGVAFIEEFSEECKARGADTTMAGFALRFGVIPFVGLACMVLAVLVILSSRSQRRNRFWHALATTACCLLAALVLATGLLSGSLTQLAPPSCE